MKCIVFTSDSDYFDVSEKKNVKKKVIKEDQNKMNSTLKKKKNSKSPNRKFVALDQTIDHMVSTTISFKGNDNSIKKVINKPPLNTASNESISSKKCDSVNDNAHSNLIISKPLPPTNLEKPCSSSLTSSNTHYNTENQYYITQNLKIGDNMESTQSNDGEEYRIDGMLQLISTYTITISIFYYFNESEY